MHETDAPAHTVGRVFDAVLRSIEGLSARVTDLIRAAAAREARPALAELAPLRLEILGILRGHAPLVTGTGFVAAPDVLADAPLWLEWWESGDAPERLVVDLDPASRGFYDYTERPWFTVPRRTRGPNVHGPYVDHHGTDQYTLTMSTPVLDGEEFLGITGADLYLRRVEKAVLPLLPRGAILLNAQGRVVISRSARHVTGALLRRLDVDAADRAPVEAPGGTLTRCGELRLYLLTP
ncbi:cache domain-containing protein [Actinomadura vinacea]|uniref:Cache domain-containing protein n=1 Tax=Actinomadura vinacea TaxID=115336 RepID=A0ABN3KEV5_9ACTN